MPNSNSQIDGLGSFNQSAENAGTIKYGAFLNAARNTGSIALSATFGNTSQNLGTIGDVLPITTATIVQSNSAKWDSTYTTVMQNSAMWALSGGTSSVTETFVSDVIDSIINTDNFVLTSDSRLSDIPMGVEAYTYLQSNSGDFIVEGDARLSDSRTPLSHTHDASAITSGKLDVDRIPVLPSMEVVVIEGIMYDNNAFAGSDENLLVDGFTYQLSSIAKGTVVTTTDGNRFVYKGEGGKRFASSYIQLADITPEWSTIASKPATFSPSSHTHTISEVDGLPSVVSVVVSNSAQWGSGTIEGHTAYTFVSDNSASIVYTTDARLSDARPPTTHYHDMVDISGLNSALDLKLNLSEFSSLKTTVTANSATWNKAAQGFTAYTYVSANSANIVMTSDSRLSNATSAYSYVNANSASIVMTSDSRLEEATTAYTSVQTNSATWEVGARGSINYTIDGGGSAIATGSKGFIQVPNNFIIQQWDIIADLQTTSFIVDVRKSSYDNLPTTTSIVGSDFLTLTNQQKNRNLSVSWTNISAGDFVEFYVTDASNASMINISLKGIRS
jgi:hypothetical protein